MRPASRRPVTLLLALLLCGALAALSRAHLFSPVTGSLRDALLPGQVINLHISRWWHLHVASLMDGPHLARENQNLRTQVHTLSVQAAEAADTQAENVRLRALLDFQQKNPRTLLAAEVIAVKPLPQADTVTLSRGRIDRVHIQQIVLSAEGTLVGQVLDVSPHSCSVLLLSDSSSSVSAQTRRGTAPLDAPPGGLEAAGLSGPVGLCQGDRTGTLTLTDLPAQADVLPGDIVSTSGLGGIFPKGLKIGTVLSVSTDRTRSIKTCRVRPAADLDHLEDAWLLQ